MLRVTTSANAMNEVPLYAAEDVERGGHRCGAGFDSILCLAYAGWLP